MNYESAMTLLKDVQIDTKNKMKELEEFIYKQESDLAESQLETIKIKKKINSKILEITDEINEFTNSKEPKCYQDEIDRLWAKRIVLEELFDEIDK